MSNASVGVYEMWNIAILVIENYLQMGNLFILLFIFDQATDQTVEYSALISFDACEKYCSPGTRMVFKSKIKRNH